MQPKIVLLIFVSGKARRRSEQGLSRLGPPAWPRPLLGPPGARLGPPAESADRASVARDRPASRHPIETQSTPSRQVVLTGGTDPSPNPNQVVLTGGKLRKEIYAAFEQIYPVLQEFRKSTVDAPPVAA